MHDHTGFTSYTSFETMRSNKPTIYDKYIDISKNKMPQIYYNSHFMIFRGHGNKYGITLDDYDFTTTDMNNLA